MQLNTIQNSLGIISGLGGVLSTFSRIKPPDSTGGFFIRKRDICHFLNISISKGGMISKIEAAEICFKNTYYGLVSYPSVL